jgi:hypothetical protein
LGTTTWDLSQWDDPIGAVTLDNDHTVDLYAIVVEAVSFLRQQLNVASTAKVT